MRTLFKNAKIVTASEILVDHVCIIENSKIVYLGKEPPFEGERVDCHGNYLIPGFIDLHCHGGNGLDFSDANLEEVEQIAAFHLSHGTTTMLATTLTAPMYEITAALDTLSAYFSKHKNGVLKGVFMEGPWLNSAACGAQDANNMRPPSSNELQSLKRRYPFLLRVAAAPELKGGMEFGRIGKELGIVASVAHTDADFETIEQANQNGYELMTHLYSGMKGVERKNAYRIAGAVEAGLFLKDMYAEIIADGKHLPLSLLKFIYYCKGADRLCLVTDGTRASGLKNGARCILGSKKSGVEAIIEDDVAKLPDRQSFAGSAATADRLYKTMAEAIGKDMVALSKMASLTPARLMGWHDRGEIAVGKRADLLLLNEELEIKKIITEKEN